MSKQKILEKYEFGAYIGGKNYISVLATSLDELEEIISCYSSDIQLEITYVGNEDLPIEIFKNKKIALVVENPLVCSNEFCKQMQKENVSIKITDDLYTRYTFTEIFAINTKIRELINSIPSKSDDFTKLATVYKALGENIFYDETGCMKSDKHDIARTSITRSLKGAFLEGKCVCHGYAVTLSKVLNILGIENLVISGRVEEDEEEADHSWNQVKIDGKWYNVDLSWDSILIQNNLDVEFFLLSDNDFLETREILYADLTSINRYLSIHPETDFSKIPTIMSPQKCTKKFSRTRVFNFFYYTNPFTIQNLLKRLERLSYKVLKSSDLNIRDLIPYKDNNERKR